MRKIILLIGLLIYSSPGWTEELVMECFYSDDSSDIYKLNTEEPDTSDELLMERHEGNWSGLCGSSVCIKGDDSVISVEEGLSIVFDFRFLIQKIKILSSHGRVEHEEILKCKKW